jgi:hypothetical protein
LPEPGNDFSSAESDIAVAYNEVATCGEKLYEINQLIKQCNISAADYKSLRPIFVTALTKSPDLFKTTSISVQLHITFSKVSLDNFKAYALDLSD